MPMVASATDGAAPNRPAKLLGRKISASTENIVTITPPIAKRTTNSPIPKSSLAQAACCASLGMTWRISSCLSTGFNSIGFARIFELSFATATLQFQLRTIHARFIIAYEVRDRPWRFGCSKRPQNLSHQRIGTQTKQERPVPQAGRSRLLQMVLGFVP